MTRWALTSVGLVAVAVTAVANPGDLWFISAWVGYLVMGSLVLRQQPRHRLGWLMLVTGSLSTVLLCLGGTAVGPGAGPPALESVLRALTVWPWLAICAIVTLFPDGVAHERSQRVLIRVIVGSGVVLTLTFVLGAPTVDSGRANPWAIDVLGVLAPIVNGGGFLAIPLLLIVAFVGVLRRWRRVDGVGHSQGTCLLFGAAATAAGFALGFATDGTILASVSWAGALLALPVSIGVAILRFRLYEIDRIISRTASYAIVTALVLATYALVVTTLSRLLPTSSTLAVAGATLAAAALARPLLTRVQGVVDRRFNRSRYDAARTVEAFGERLRTEVDADDVVAGLEGVIVSTLQPSAVGLWLPSR